MICRACGSDDQFFVLSTRSYGDKTITKRRIECACGRRWTTIEIEEEGSAIMVDQSSRPLSVAATATGSALPVVGGDVPPLLVAGANGVHPLPVAGAPPQKVANPLPVAGRGVGGALSPVRSGLPLFPSYPDPDPSDDLDQEVDRPRVKAAGPISYPEAFAAFWDHAESPSPKGLKSVAVQRWERQGKPAADVLLPKWREYLESLGDQHAMHICRWIGNRGWEEVYESARALRRPAPARASQTRESAARFLERHGREI